LKKLLILLAILIAAAAAFFYVKHRTRSAVAGVPTTPSYHEINAQDQIALVHLACKGQIKINKDQDGDAYSCSACPPNSDFAGETDTPDAAWTADRAITEGSFTAPHLHEAVMHIQGCESHATGFGGAFLYRFTEGAWQLVRYLHGAPIDGCDVLPFLNDRDALICESSDMHQGIASDSVQLLMVDSQEPKEDQAFDKNTFLMVTDEAGYCLDPINPDSLIQYANVDKVALISGQNGRKDLAIDTTIGRVKRGHVTGDNCPDAPKKQYHLVFRNMGDHFEAAEGYAPVAALKREDCCEVAIGKIIQPASY